MHKALTAGNPSAAMIHLQLARMHREKREEATAEDRFRRVHSPPAVYKTDKEA